MGWLAFERDKTVAFLHRVLDDPVGILVASLFRAGESRADVTLSISPYDDRAGPRGVRDPRLRFRDRSRFRALILP